MTQDSNSLVLYPEDHKFIQDVINDITEDHSLPFSLPPASIPRIIKKSAQFFHEEDDSSVQERWIMIRYSDIVRDSTLNAVVRLPKCIYQVWQLYQLNNRHGLGDPLRFIREPMLYGSMSMGGAVNDLNGGGSGFSGGRSSVDRSEMYETGLVSMYAYNQSKTMFTKGIRFDYNEYTNELNFLGEVTGDIVFAAFQKIPLTGLYNNRKFFDHVRGSVMERLQKILSMFQFQFPGDVSINFSEIQAAGRDLREKTEETVKADSSANDIFIIN